MNPLVKYGALIVATAGLMYGCGPKRTRYVEPEVKPEYCIDVKDGRAIVYENGTMVPLQLKIGDRLFELYEPDVVKQPHKSIPLETLVIGNVR